MKYEWKKVISIILILALMGTIVGVSPSIAASKKPVLNKKVLSLYVGSSYVLKVKNNKKKVTWTSSKKSYATVSKSGKVVGKKAGSVVITAKFGNKKLVCKVTVKKKVVPVPVVKKLAVSCVLKNKAGEFLPGVKVKIYKKDSEDSDIDLVTNSKGGFTTSIYPGQYVLATYGNTGSTDVATFTVTKTSTKFVFSIDYYLVTGVLKDYAGAPISDFYLFFYKNKTKVKKEDMSYAELATDQKGNYSVLLPAGSFLVEEKINDTVAPVEIKEIPHKNTVWNLQIKNPFYSVSGTIANGEGTPLSMYPLYFYREGETNSVNYVARVNTASEYEDEDDDSGTYELNLEPGKYQAKLYRNQTFFQVGTVEVTTKNVVKNLYGNFFTLSGKVTLGEGSPMKEGTLNFSMQQGNDLYGKAFDVMVETDGTYEVLLPSGTFEVNWDSQYNNRIKGTNILKDNLVVVGASKVKKDFTIKLYQVSGAIKDYKNAVALGAQVIISQTVQGEKEILCSVSSQEDGTYNLYLPSGTYDIDIQYGGDLVGGSIEVNNQNITKSFVVAAKTYEVKGVVKNNGGSPIEDCMLYFYKENAVQGDSPIALANTESGSYVVSLQSGNYIIGTGVVSEPWSTVQKRTLTVLDKGMVKNIQIDETKVSGSVKTTSGISLRTDLYFYDEKTNAFVTKVSCYEDAGFETNLPQGAYVVKTKLGNEAISLGNIIVGTTAKHQDYNLNRFQVSGTIVNTKSRSIEAGLEVYNSQGKLLVSTTSTLNNENEYDAIYLEPGTYQTKVVYNKDQYDGGTLVVKNSDLVKNFSFNQVYYLVTGQVGNLLNDEIAGDLKFYLASDNTFSTCLASQKIYDFEENYSVYFKSGTYVARYEFQDESFTIGSFTVKDQAVEYNINLNRSSILGYVKTDTGQAIMNTEILFMQEGSSQYKFVKSDETGAYETILMPGVYSIKVAINNKLYGAGQVTVTDSRVRKNIVVSLNLFEVTGIVKDLSGKEFRSDSVRVYKKGYAGNDDFYTEYKDGTTGGYQLWLPAGTYETKILLNGTFYEAGEIQVTSSLHKNLKIGAKVSSMIDIFLGDAMDDANPISCYLYSNEGVLISSKRLAYKKIMGWQVFVLPGIYSLKVERNGVTVDYGSITVTDGVFSKLFFVSL